MSDKRLWDYHQKENRIFLYNAYPRQRLLLKHIRKRLSKGSSILENGFGDGYLLNRLSKDGNNVVGQDISQDNIDITKKQWNNHKIAFVLGDVSGKILAQDNSLDAYIASEVLEHMTNDELSFHINEIYRVLKPGGHGFITFPAKENLKANECICPKCGEIFHKRGHKQYWDKKRIYYIFRQFKILTLRIFVSRIQGTNFFSSLIGYIKVAGSYLLNINKSYLLVFKK